jgi:uncharacterized protein YceH (UPF0502 family)
MKTNLSLNETRVIGCLIEKQKTTPEQYPLSLNALTNACNQKSNRDPVLKLSEIEVQDTVDALIAKHLVAKASGYGGRVEKYQQRFAGTEFSEFSFNDKALAILCVLFLRGPQTPGELRSRTNRLCEFHNIQQVEETLQGLIDDEAGPFVVKLQREPGRREARYAHLFSGEVSDLIQTPDSGEAFAAAESVAPGGADSLIALEERIAMLERRLADLESKFAQWES